MKSNYLNRFIQNFLSKHYQHRWTRWDTLGLILIVSILPFLCGNPFTYYQLINKNKQAEGKNYVNSITRSQQTYFLEQKHFAKSIQELNININKETENYNYSTISNNTTTYTYGIPKKNHLKSYISGVFIMPNSEMQTIGIICENKTLGTIKPTKPDLQNNLPVCGQGTSEIGKFL